MANKRYKKHKQHKQNKKTGKKKQFIRVTKKMILNLVKKMTRRKKHKQRGG